MNPHSNQEPEDDKMESIKPHRVTVPVFLEVELPAEDDMQAEVRAVELVRELGDLVVEGASAVLRVKSVIIPLVSQD